MAAPPPGASAQTAEQPLGPVVVLAHRGQSFDAPEHTVPAYDLATSSGADFLECDLQLTADEVLVCVHDTTVDRTSDGTGRVDSFTFAELQQLDFGSWFNQRTPDRARPEYEGLRVVAFGVAGGRQGPGAVDPDTFLAAGLAPPESLGQFPDSVDIAAPDFAYILANPSFPALAHDHGREVHTYTVDDEMQMERLLDLGVDRIFTNRADVLHGVVDERGTGGAGRGAGHAGGLLPRLPAARAPRARPGDVDAAADSGSQPPPEDTSSGDGPSEEAPTVERLEADDAVTASLAWSAAVPDGRGGEVLLARDDLFVDALASGGAQGLLDAPLLLTDGDALDSRVAAELRRIGPERVTLLGGTAAISDDVEGEVADLGASTSRAAGATRVGRGPAPSGAGDRR